MGKHGNKHMDWGNGIRRKGNVSQFWKEIHGVKEIFTAGNSYLLGNGRSIRVWKDKWINNEQLKYAAPKLLVLSNQKESSVKDHYKRENQWAQIRQDLLFGLDTNKISYILIFGSIDL